MEILMIVLMNYLTSGGIIYTARRPYVAFNDALNEVITDEYFFISV